MVADFLQNTDYYVYAAEFRLGLVVISKGPGYITVYGDIELGVIGVALGDVYCETVLSCYLAGFFLVRAVTDHYCVACTYGL